MREFDDDPDNAYILIRVSGVESDQPGLKLFVSPWRLYLDRVIDFRSELGYQVVHEDASVETVSENGVEGMSVAPSGD